MVLSVLKPSDSKSTLTMIFLFLANSCHSLLSLPVSEVACSSRFACLGGAHVLFWVHFFFFKSSTSVQRLQQNLVAWSSLTPKGAAGHGQGSQLGHLLVLLLLGIILLAQFLPGLCICFLVRTRTLQFIFKEDKERKKKSGNN